MSHRAGSYVHPLMRKTIGGACSPTELLEEWTQEMAKDTPSVGGLEGVLYRVASFQSEDLILLCLDVADGYRTNEWDFCLLSEKESRHHRNPGKLRLAVVQKAFWALCEGVFKDRRRDIFEQPSWARFMVQERIFKKILWFIFDEDRRSDTYTNLPSRPRDGSFAHQEHIFHTFVVDLVRYTWNFRGLGNRWDEETDKRPAQMFEQARPQLIQILYKVSKLNLLKRLAPIDPSHQTRGLNGRERRVLRELAIDRGCAGGSGEGVWKMVEEGVAKGNPAAEFLWCYLPRVKRLRRRLSDRRRKAREDKEERKRQVKEALQAERDKAEARLKALSENPR